MKYTYYRTTFTGEQRATCVDCGRTWAYWEDEDDLNHRCHYRDTITHRDGSGHCDQCGSLMIPGDTFYCDDPRDGTYYTCSLACADQISTDMDEFVMRKVAPQ